jgi:hypothetical protein
MMQINWQASLKYLFSETSRERFYAAASEKGRLFGKFLNRAVAAAQGVRPQTRPRGGFMAYVLIVVSWLGGVVNGAAISTQEFTSAERCEAARMALIEDAKARNFDDTLKPFCMQK